MLTETAPVSPALSMLHKENEELKTQVHVLQEQIAFFTNKLYGSAPDLKSLLLPTSL